MSVFPKLWRPISPRMDIFSVNFAPNEFFPSPIRPYGSFSQSISSPLSIGSAQFTDHLRFTTIARLFTTIARPYLFANSQSCVFLLLLQCFHITTPFRPRAKFRPIWETLAYVTCKDVQCTLGIRVKLKIQLYEWNYILGLIGVWVIGLSIQYCIQVYT